VFRTSEGSSGAPEDPKSGCRRRGRPGLDPDATPGEHSKVLRARVPLGLAEDVETLRVQTEARVGHPVSVSSVIREALESFREVHLPETSGPRSSTSDLRTPREDHR